MVGGADSGSSYILSMGILTPPFFQSQLLKVHLAARQPTATTLRDSMKGNGTQAGT